MIDEAWARIQEVQVGGTKRFPTRGSSTALGAFGNGQGWELSKWFQ